MFNRSLVRSFACSLAFGLGLPYHPLTRSLLSRSLPGTVLFITTNPITTALGLFNIFLYAPIYTMTKPRHEINTWVGAIVGAIPPVMGWTASGGSLLDPESIFLASSLFLWQFPHFFALSWMHRQDYSRGGFQMVPCNDPTGDRTANLISNYSLYLSVLPIASCLAGVSNPMFAVEGCMLNAYFLYCGKQFNKDRSNQNARKIFLTSLWYLPCLLGLFIFHCRNWEDKEREGVLTEKILSLKEQGRNFCLHENIEAETMCPVGRHTKSKEASSEPPDPAKM